MQKSIIMDKRIIGCILVFLTLSCMLTGCTNREPPDIEAMEAYFQKNYDDILLVTSFLIQQEGSVHIDYDRDDFESWFDVKVPQKIKKTIMSLRENQRIVVSKRGNTIVYTIWIPDMTEKDCGIAFSINGTDIPEIEYATVITPLSKPGWYYYVVDFNEWRLNNR